MIKNMADATNERIGAKFVEWLILEREWQAALKDMYSKELSHISDSDDLDIAFDDKDKPMNKTTILADIERMRNCLRKQQAAYDELYELADLNIAGGL